MYAKHGNLVDAKASGAKASTKHLRLKSRLAVIQGHALGITEKPTKDCIPCIMMLDSSLKLPRKNPPKTF